MGGVSGVAGYRRPVAGNGVQTAPPLGAIVGSILYLAFAFQQFALTRGVEERLRCGSSRSRDVQGRPSSPLANGSRAAR
jgi:hypothetical protein